MQNHMQIRNPCYDLGDVAVLRAVDVPGLHHLRDCLVLSTRGPRPQADMLSGGKFHSEALHTITLSCEPGYEVTLS